ncbi:MAG: sugar transferase, partial [Gemmatimonadales bacterium]|nr:sugar transferase [Gemmatimonadales bacterium]
MRWMEALVERSGSAPSLPPRAWAPAGEHAPDEPAIEPAPGAARWAIRGVNFLVALVALVVLFPVLMLVALVVRLTSRGPVLYLQERVGLDRRELGRAAQNHRRGQDLGGRPFTIYKFRTMRHHAERESGAVWAQQHDPRVTPVGRILRQYRLDELPQLVNVLRGEMNIVGPRPERPTIFAELRTQIAEYPLR